MGYVVAKYMRCAHGEFSTGYTVAKYIRLSIEDKRTQSCSIANQHIQLNNFIEAMPEKNIRVLEFVDNGYSGTNLERPALQEMLELVRAGEIDCIVVKDFSRFGRNLIDTGYFIEQVFPLYKVRFIAVTDGYDSAAAKYNTSGIDVTFKFLINELYSKELGQKIRQAKRQRAEQGLAVNKNCTFGYMLNEKREMVIDPEAAPTVRLLFSLALQGIGTNQIAATMNERQIVTPGAYRKQKKGKPTKEPYNWTAGGVRQLLDNEAYIGTYIRGTTTNTEVGGKHFIKTPEDTWIRIENHHPAIISKEDYATVKAMKQLYSRKR